MTDEFATMPEIPQEFLDEQNRKFASYLFFETKKPGVREYTCSFCGQKTTLNRNEVSRMETPELRELRYSTVNDCCVCPSCGKSGIVKNIKRCDLCNLNVGRYVVFVLKTSSDEIWFRALRLMKEYNTGYGENETTTLHPEMEFTEYCRYKLIPGKAEKWYRDWYSGRLRKIQGITEAFNGDYELMCCNESGLEDTFLKYNSYNFGAPYLKYLCFYATHPKLEMLSKLGFDDILSATVPRAEEYPTYLDWNANTPWEFFKLNRQQYNEWFENYYHDFQILKVYKYMRYKSFKDFKKAEELCDFFRSTKKIKSINVLARKEKKTAYDALKYFNKISKDSGYGCHQCPGISPSEAYSEWRDYIDMLPKDSKNLPLFPYDLKRRHDEMMAKKNKEQEEKAKKERLKKVKMLTEDAEKGFPKVNKILEKIKEKYEYHGDKFRIIVPRNLEELITESVKLNLCIHTAPTGRYYDRIERDETYIFFLRKNDKPKEEYYLLEAEPDGTLRQKRTYNDTQNTGDLNEFLPFIVEWQNELKKRLTKADKTRIAESKRLRNEGFTDLRKTKKRINYGEHCGELLVDVLERDLFEAG